MYCESLSDCFEQISAYADRAGTGYPLFVDAENFNDYQRLLRRLKADESKEVISVSEHTFINGLPNLQEVIELISGNGCYVAAGISQSLMLQGEKELDEMLDKLLSISIQGHAIVLVSHCRIYLERYRQRDPRLENRIIFIKGETSSLPQIRLASSEDTVSGIPYKKGIAPLIAELENITDTEISRHPYVTVVSQLSPKLFCSSMYAISESAGVYDILAEKYPDFASAADKAYGTEDQWNWLQKEMKGYKSFSEYVTSRFSNTTGLAAHLSDVLLTGDTRAVWLLWLALKTFGVGSNRYLKLVLANSSASADFEEHIYKDLLEVNHADKIFDQLYSERKQLIAKLPENLNLVKSYCQLVGRHGKNAAYYLTDATENEEFTFMQLVDQYDWTDEELKNVIAHGFPELALYMQPFVFDSANTILPEKDADFRKDLTEYFDRYKSQKIRNCIDNDFLDKVNQLAAERPFYKLQARSGILSAMDRKNAQGYFFDALGVEYLAYIQAKCEQYGLIYEINIAHAELPTITEKNEDFQHYFETKNIGDLDELKHHSLIYDYQACKYPIHIFRELAIIDTELRRIRAQLIQNQSTTEKAVIVSDHGASRLAVIYQHENDSVLRLDEKGVHSGRCCQAETDPKIPFAAYEEGYAVLGNYERFKGGRRANLEVHGGASLEETVVPVITIALRPDNVVYYFVDPVIKYKAGQNAEIVLFSNVPMKEPRLLVDGVFYDGVFQKDKNHALFSMSEPKRVREYTASIYEGNANTGMDLTFRIERNTKVRDLF